MEDVDREADGPLRPLLTGEGRERPVGKDAALVETAPLKRDLGRRHRNRGEWDRGHLRAMRSGAGCVLSRIIQGGTT